MHSVREVGAGWHKAPEQELRSSAPEMALLLLLCCGHSLFFEHM
jgi:GMP synthase-like glutamine amidotransferase